MKKYTSFLKILILAVSATFFTGCVQDDKYAEPDLTGYQCLDITPDTQNTLITYKAVRDFYRNNTTVPGNKTYVIPETSTDYIEGYVSSNDESGNIYKTIYIQDKPENPTAGFVLSVDDVSTYTKFPQGSKIYVKLKGLAVGTYGDLIQLGVKDAETTANGVSRIPEKLVGQHIFKSCTIKEKIVPKVMTLAQMVSANDELLGVLVQVNDAEFDRKNLCSTFAPEGTSVDKQINDPTASLTTRVVRNSGFASFANQQLPAGKGTFIGIYSKFNSSYQLYINRLGDLADMTHYPRKDGITSNPCIYDPNSVTSKTVAEVKQLINGTSLTQITGNFAVTGKVTANDETGNLFKYIYIEDATGGIRVNINKTSLYLDPRFKVGKEVIIKLKDLYIGNVSGELQLGQPFGSNVGQIVEVDIYKFFFDSNRPATPVIPTDKKITELTAGDVGKWIRIKDVQFKTSEIGNSYATGGAVRNRLLEDCSGNEIILRTSNFASFAGEEIDDGKGDIYAILSIFNGTYQLWAPKQINADFDNIRCDGGIPSTILFKDGFQSGLANWTTYNIAGPQVWNTSNQGTGANYYAVLNGANVANEDWLVSKEISLTGFNKYSVSYLTDGSGSNQNLVQFLITDSFTGDVKTTNWVTLTGRIDTILTGFGFDSSGRVNISNFANKKVRIAVKYISAPNASATWEVDNIQVRGIN